MSVESDEVLDLIGPETGEIQGGRSKVTVMDNRIDVSAEDATALRTTLNSVCKLLIVHEKMRGLESA